MEKKQNSYLHGNWYVDQGTYIRANRYIDLHYAAFSDKHVWEEWGPMKLEGSGCVTFLPERFSIYCVNSNKNNVNTQSIGARRPIDPVTFPISNEIHGGCIAMIVNHCAGLYWRGWNQVFHHGGCVANRPTGPHRT